jgi:hypothetical protein
MLVNPASAIASRPETMITGTQGEANIVIGYSYYAWDETPGALDMMVHLCAKLGIRTEQSSLPLSDKL